MEDRGSGIFSRGDAVAIGAALVLLAAAGLLGPAAARYGGSMQTALLQVLLATAGIVGNCALFGRTGNRRLVAIVVVGVAARLLLVMWPPLQSNDVYRYLWDGRLLLHGFDPYVLRPDAPQLHALRAGNWLYAHIDWRAVPTLYPPFDLALYALGAALSSASIMPLKCVMLAGDLLAIGAIAVGLRLQGLPLGRLALYAWSPLAIVEFGLNGHEEGWAVFFLVGTLVALSAHRPLGAAFALAGAVLTKLYPAAFVPVLFAPRRLAPFALACIAAVITGYLPFVLWNHNVLGFLRAFAFGYHFNDSLHLVLGTLGAAVLFAAALVAATIARMRGASVVGVLLGLEVVYFLLSPNVYPWYLAVILALLPFVRHPFTGKQRPFSLALVAWTLLAPLAYLAPWVTPQGSVLDVAARVLEYSPLVAAGVWYALRDGRRFVTLVIGAFALAGCANVRAATQLAPHAQIERGAAFYAANCAICHTPTATSFIGPDLTHVAARRSRANLRAHISTSVPNGTTFSPATIAALIAYLEQLNGRPVHP